MFMVILCIVLAIEVGNLLLHSLGFRLLLNLKQNKENQRLFLLNLTCSEILWNLLLVVRDIYLISKLVGGASSSYTALWCLNMAFSTGVTYIYILAMFYLTLDRLLHITLHMRYTQYWCKRNTKILFAITWISNIALSIVLALLTYYELDYVMTKIHMFVSIYLWTIMNIIYLVFAMVTYLTLFILHLKSERKIRRISSSASGTSILSIFKQSRFSIIAILITSYIVLTIVPSVFRIVIWVFYPLSTIKYTVEIYYLFSTRLSSTVDGIVYIFLQKTIRQLLVSFCTTRYNTMRNLRKEAAFFSTDNERCTLDINKMCSYSKNSP